MSPTVDAPLEWGQSVGELRLPSKTDEHLQKLMDRNNAGLLSEVQLAEREFLGLCGRGDGLMTC